MIDRFGRYHLLRRLARGGTSELFLARREEGPGDTVVLRRLLPHLAHEPALRALLEREAAWIDGPFHPNLVRVLDAGWEAGSPFVVLEWVPGCSLAQLFAAAQATQAAIPVGVALAIARAAAAGLGVLHDGAGRASGPWIHGDVSPGNVLLSRRGAVKLGDLGHAGPADGSHVPGTFAYAAPELARRRPAGPPADVFALGAILWELLTGRRLFRRPTALRSLAAAVRADVPPPGRYRPGLPGELEARVLEALHPDPASRPSTGGRFADLLERVPSERAGPDALARLVERLCPDAPA